MKKVITLAMGIIIVLTAILTLNSCQEDDVYIEDPISTIENPISAMSEKQQLNSNNPSARSSSILDAESSTDIPSQFFRVRSKYKRAYKHLKQRTNECSWTSYIVTAGAIIKGDGGDYEVTNYIMGEDENGNPIRIDKVARVKQVCRNMDNCNNHWYSDCGSSIVNLESFAINYDELNVHRTWEYNSTAGRFATIKQMLNHIDKYGTPFIVVGSSGPYGHYYVVWSIDWKSGGTGSTIYYTNTLDAAEGNFDQQIKNSDLSDFLNLMVDVPRGYNCLFLW